MLKRLIVNTIAVLKRFWIILTTRVFRVGDSIPLWAYTPNTISPEWGDLLVEIGQGREVPVPSPENISGWKEMQASKAEEGEAIANETAEALNITYEEIEIGGLPGVDVTPRTLAREDMIAVYLHGGAYVFHSAKGNIMSMGIFSNATGLRVIGIDYTLAPHSKWQQTTDEVVAVFQSLLEQGYEMDDIVLYGDSAGGGLAASGVLKMRDLGMGMPSVLILWSPWSDISETGDTYMTLRDAEPFYTYEHVLGPAALAYADAKDHHHPYVSPVYGDFSQGFPATLIQGGTKELFLSNFIRLYQAIDQAGQTVKLDIYEGVPHVFQHMLSDTPESRVAMKKVSEWVNMHSPKLRV